MRSSIAPSLVALLALAPLVRPLVRPLAAQASAEPAGPRASSWGGEVMFPESRVSLLRFGASGRTAFVIGFRGSLARETREFNSPIGPTEEESSTNTAVGVNIGVRSYAGDGRLRPVRGIGLLATHATGMDDFRYVQAGAYAELGAHYFVTSHASLGIVGELRGYWARSRYGNGAEQRLVAADVTIARVGAAVYF